MPRPGARGRAGSVWWIGCALLAGGAGLGMLLAPALIDWQPALAWHEPWRWWSAAFVHLSAGHLAANLAGAVVVGAFGWAAGCGVRDAAAWSVAWPLTHLSLLMRPEVLHYGGLSGVLHAGVAVAALGLVLRERGRRRWIGAAVLAGLLVKLASERPWGPAVQTWPGWDIAVVPWAHAGGVAAGLACAAVAWATGRSRALATMTR
jgi:rhomboid family GlyGly-CTERM serine protease